MTSCKFCSDSRIKEKKDFSKVFKEGKKVSFSNFLFFIKKSETNSSRLGIIVTKKASKKAVIRNKIKRHVREFFRTSSEFKNTAVDIVLLFNRKPESFLKDPNKLLASIKPQNI